MLSIIPAMTIMSFILTKTVSLFQFIECLSIGVSGQSFHSQWVDDCCHSPVFGLAFWSSKHFFLYVACTQWFFSENLLCRGDIEFFGGASWTILAEFLLKNMGFVCFFLLPATPTVWALIQVLHNQRRFHLFGDSDSSCSIDYILTISTNNRSTIS